MDIEKEMQKTPKNIYVINVEMENKTAEEIAKDAVTQIAELFDKLVEHKRKTDITSD